MKYNYPAVFTLDMNDVAFPKGIYLISFPDLPNCYTSGETFDEAYEMAKDILSLALCGIERDKGIVPEPTPIRIAQNNNSGSIVVSIEADTTEYRKTMTTNL